MGTEDPSGVQGQNMEILKNTNGAVTKKMTYGDGGHASMSPSGYAPGKLY